jgi:phospholipid-translocating ATPase
MVCGRGEVETEDRVVETGNSALMAKYGDNRVVHSKYTLLTFLPLMLWQQLRRFMNLYFIIIACLQLWRDVSPVNPLTTWGPIIVIFAIAFIREGVDDFNQHRQDAVMNEREYACVRDGQEVQLKSWQLQAGDLVSLHRNAESPADLALVHTSEADGLCYIQTANLDGETNLKERRALAQTQSLGKSGISGQSLFIRCAAPNALLYNFESDLHIGDAGAPSIPMSEQQLIQAGTHLRNARQILGIVCYNGAKTKLGMNQQPPPVKWTQIERFINRASVFIFCVQILFAILCGAIANEEKRLAHTHDPYLRWDLGETLNDNVAWIILYVRCYLLTSVMIPISLKVTLDICKYIYALWIRNDRQMFDIATAQRPLVNNTSVIEDLGAIEYIFSDKTGTMTQNEMKLKKVGVRQWYYGHSETADNIFDDTDLKRLMTTPLEGDVDPDSQRGWFEKVIACLSTCHTVKLVPSGSQIHFEGVSAEETSFLNALTTLGFHYTQPPDAVTYKCEAWSIPETTYEIIHTIGFSFERKRMSVIAKNRSTGRYFVFMKGAHEILGRYAPESYPEFLTAIDTFASRGLRVMALSYKEVTEEEVTGFQEAVSAARANQDGRAAAITELQDNFEGGQIMLGCAGIEDRLQEGVPQTIEMLREAGIHVWMVTGDLQSTALKIARSSRLIADDGFLFNLAYKKDGVTAQQILDALSEWIEAHPGTPFYLVLDGSCPLIDEYLDVLSVPFGRVAAHAKCVICARTTPRQKAKYVDAIKALGRITLAIGDGGNDVTMINTSHIGIGVIGKEGRQAAAASDFAITQFQSLGRLLLVHGRFDNYRTAWLVQFCFYKSLMLVLVQVGYMFWNGYSGASFLGDFNLMCYNAIFTILPVIFFLFDKDISEVTAFLHPYLYSDSRLRTFCNVRSLFWWLIRGIYQAIAILIVVHFSCTVDHVNDVDGSAISLDEAQQIAYSVLILNVLLTTTYDTKHFTSLNLIFIWGNWLLYLLLTVLANLIAGISMTREIYQVSWRVYSNPLHWIIVISAVSLSVSPVMLIQSLFAVLLPSRAQQLRDIEVERQSQFLPTYLVSLENVGENFHADALYTERQHPPTVWDKSHNVCKPLCALFGFSFE